MHRFRWWLLALLALAVQPGIATVSGITAHPVKHLVPATSLALPGGLPVNEPDADCN